MYSKSFLFVVPNASERRLHELVDRLKAHGCKVPVTRTGKRIDFDVADCNVWWIARGGLRHLVSDFADVATWVDDFYDDVQFEAAVNPQGFVEA